MKLILDTNAYSRFDVGQETTLRAVEEAESLFLPVIVYGELYYGFRHGQRFQENMRRLDRFLSEFDVEIIPVDTHVAKKFGDIYASLRKKGRPIPTNDIWIAACCITSGGTLLTHDSHFKEIDQIEVRVISDD